jgi:putative ABC transport system permease protein
MGVLIAILLATLNTMLMSGREQTRDVGVLKALGFGGGAAFWLLLSQAILLCGVGAGAGILFALGVEGPLRRTLGSSFPGFEINQEVTLPAISVAIAVALIAGLAPALRARRLTVIEALREEF